jgi:hypothetical protein
MGFTSIGHLFYEAKSDLQVSTKEQFRNKTNFLFEPSDSYTIKILGSCNFCFKHATFFNTLYF